MPANTGMPSEALGDLADNLEEYAMRRSGIPFEYIPLDAIAQYQKDMARVVVQMADPEMTMEKYTDLDFTVRQIQYRLNKAIGEGVRVMDYPGHIREVGRGERRARGVDISVRNTAETAMHFFFAKYTIPLSIAAGLGQEVKLGKQYVEEVIDPYRTPKPYIPGEKLFHTLKDLGLGTGYCALLA